MCGIVGYVGTKPCRQSVLEGLSRLEYRGYDSAGFVCVDTKHGHLSYHKEAGGVSLISRMSEAIKFDGTTGIGHTRWATHGVVDQRNAHPHFNCRKSLAVVHNGIVERYEILKDRLIAQGHDFSSTTDTEVVAHLFSSLVSTHGDLKKAALEFVKQITGAFSLIFLHEDYPDTLILIRRRSPMIIGIGQNEMFVASDFLAFSDKTDTALFMPDESIAFVKKDWIDLVSFEGATLPQVTQHIEAKYTEIGKQDFEHYMLKEIYEQKKAILRTISFCKVIGSSNPDPLDSHNSTVDRDYNDCMWRQIGLTKEQIRGLKYLNLVAAGTSWHATRIAQFFFETVCKIPTKVYLASEFRYMPFFPETNSLYIMVSQSGETADTLEALRLINSFDIPTMAITNIASSTMVREATGFLPMQAGPEISVASTKAFSTQLATLYWLAHKVAFERGTITLAEMQRAEEDLYVCAEVLESAIDTYKLEITQTLAKKYSQFDRFIFLGRHVSYPFAMEAALKLKEISYIFSQCYPAGELKHGPIALIDEKTPAVLFSVLDELIYHKIVSNAHEIKSRNGHLVVFAFEGQTELISVADHAFIIPRVTPLLGPLAMTGLMQFFVYQITRELGRPIDKPRNLAKSVTVE